MPGSSAVTSTEPPFTLMVAKVIIGSAATFTPTCFMEAMLLAPAIDAPAADSMATFSFGAHSA